MKKLIYILTAAAVTMLAACEKQPAQMSETETATIAFSPEFELEAEVKSAVIGETDIWCFLYDNNTGALAPGSPYRQKEIKDDVYYYSVPKINDGYITFAIMPENATYIVSSGWYNAAVNFNDNFVTTTETELYSTGSNYDDSFGTGINTNDGGTDSFNEVLYQRHRECKLMFYFQDMPAEVTPENFIKKIHVTVGSIELDEVLTLDNMVRENIDGTDYWCKQTYLHFGYEYRNSWYDYSYIDLVIETVDNRVFTAYDLSFSYERNEEVKIKIDYDYFKEQ